MASLIQFETPENVQIAYRPAGVGTRYSAWMLDTVFVAVVTVLVFILTISLSAAVGVAVKNAGKSIPINENNFGEFPFLAMAIAWLFFGLGSFIYFTLSELFWRGQTIGKWACGVRVVKADGFALDASSIFLRNVFRIVDQLPPLWIVPVLSARSQRFGDMAAATLVVADSRDKLGELRTALLARPADQCKFRFDGTALARALPIDIEAAERILERWPTIPAEQRTALLDRISEPLARRLGVQPPEAADRREFLQDFLAAVYRREARRLG